MCPFHHTVGGSHLDPGFVGRKKYTRESISHRPPKEKIQVMLLFGYKELNPRQEGRCFRYTISDSLPAVVRRTWKGKGDVPVAEGTLSNELVDGHD